MLDLTIDHRQETADLLEAAADLLDQPDAWCQESYVTSDGRHCAIGAIRASAGYPGSYVLTTTAIAALAKWLITEGRWTSYCACDSSSCHSSSVFNWNDMEDTVQNDVVTAMRKTALGLRERVE